MKEFVLQGQGACCQSTWGVGSEVGSMGGSLGASGVVLRVLLCFQAGFAAELLPGSKACFCLEKAVHGAHGGWSREGRKEECRVCQRDGSVSCGTISMVNEYPCAWVAPLFLS